MNFAASMKSLSILSPDLAEVSAKYRMSFFSWNDRASSKVTCLYIGFRSDLLPMRKTDTSGEHEFLTSLSHPYKLSKESLLPTE
jgi:hypothetical protein